MSVPSQEPAKSIPWGKWGKWIFLWIVLGWMFWNHREDVIRQEKAKQNATRVSAARVYLFGMLRTDSFLNRYEAATWRDESENFLRVTTTGTASLAIAGQLIDADGTVRIIEGSLSPASLPPPIERAKWNYYYLDSKQVSRVDFQCLSRSADGEEYGTSGTLYIHDPIPEEGAAASPLGKLDFGEMAGGSRADRRDLDAEGRNSARLPAAADASDDHITIFMAFSGAITS